MSSKIPSADTSGSSASSIDKSLVDEYYPVRAPLCAKYKKTFAYKTIGYRLPVIITKIIDQLSRDKNEIGEKYGAEARAEVKDVVGQLAKLKNELQTNKPITALGSGIWDEYLRLVAEKYHNGTVSEVTWYLSPWLFIECYMYQRIYLAFRSTAYLKNYDYFSKQKKEGFFESVEQACALGVFVNSCKPSQENLDILLQVALWGNRCDLSLSAGESNAQVMHLLDHLHTLEKLILVNDSAEAWKTLKVGFPKEGVTTVGYVLDNAGFEMFTDLCFAELLLNEVSEVHFYVKEVPWFVSDALAHDFHWLLDTMETSSEEILNQLAQKWKGCVESGRWRVVTHGFWTLPHSFNEMEGAEPALYSTLAKHNLLIFKGDLNYRKLVGDINWEPATPFRESLRGFIPAPLLALRTCKADTVSGLRAGLSEELTAKSPDWMTTGEYGLVQFAS